MTNQNPIAKVGQHVGFKSDVEQYAEVIEVRRVRGWDGRINVSYIVKAPADGFSGHYIGRSDTAEIYHDDCFED